MSNRAAELEKNFSRMFWIQALMSTKILNVVISIFYVHRGLTFKEIFLLGVVFAVTNLVCEIPSSYMADKWGRKKTVALAVVFLAISSIFDFFSHNFFLFIIDIVFLGASYAFMTGTDDAVIYDTARELGRDKDSLKKLGNYYAAQRVVKIVTPLIAVLIAKDLLDWQFRAIVSLEFITTIFALPLVWKLIEPAHKVDVEKIEAGILLDAGNLIKRNPELIRMILNRTIVFVGAFIVWRVHQQYFLENNISLFAIGAMWTLVNLFGYLAINRIGSIFPQLSAAAKINWLNFLMILSLIVFTSSSYFNLPYTLLISFGLLCMFENIRWPIFSDVMNKHSKSFNRATTLSLSNLIKSVVDIPLMFIAAIMVTHDLQYVFIFGTVLAITGSALFYMRTRERLM